MDDFFWQYDAVGTLVTIGFVVIGLFFIVILVRSVAGWHRNNRSPRLTVNAQVVAKRIDVNHYRTANAGDMTGPSRWRAGIAWNYPWMVRNTECWRRAMPANSAFRARAISALNEERKPSNNFKFGCENYGYD